MFVTGCGESAPDVTPVHGVITLDGAPLNHAIITFQPVGKSPAVGNSDENGRYDLMYKRGVMGAPVGECVVTIFIDTYNNPQKLVIPPRYNTESELKREVARGENEFNFDLTSSEKK